MSEHDAHYNMGDFRFAHSPKTLQARQRKYLRYFQNSPVSQEHPVLDLGCGRGLFLSLLEENGIAGYGVDASAEALAEYHGACETVQSEILAYLERAESAGRFGGVFCSHVIEHLAPPEFERLTRLIARALVPGGVAIFITPNPVNLHVLSDSFWLDMSHVRPYPEPLIVRICQENGLTDRVDGGWDLDTAPRQPVYKWPLHIARRILLGRAYYQGEDAFAVMRKPRSIEPAKREDTQESR
ncbi:class I SAM-dependent methyltransferase [Candidatus Sumerlaeota bacterium]|nr:class I SAM-dependent methyltransferase [Candidatus Sumerlaeota bacterium]